MKQLSDSWRKEAGPRVEGSQPLDSGKVQAPCIVRKPFGGYRLYYTAVGPAKPFPVCQGYILSAVSEDGLNFRKEPGIRLAPNPKLAHNSLRVLAPSVTEIGGNRWRMYFESRGPADRQTVICSAVSTDMLSWELEDGMRMESSVSVRAPRYLPLPDGRGRLFFTSSVYGPGGFSDGERLSQGVVSAVTGDGLHFELEPGYRMESRQSEYDSSGISAGEVIPPESSGSKWTMVYSAWQDVPPGTEVPPHPSSDADAEKNGLSENFAAASIASDMAGYRSRIFTAYSADGMTWERGGCAIEGAGHGTEDIDAVHAEDMSVIKTDEGTYRMYYAACDKDGNWRIASAVSE